MISEKIKEINIIDIIEDAGIELKPRGNRHYGLCPFHADTSPSLVIFPNNRWWCFSCQIGGDVVNFIQRLYGFNFKNACKHLGIDTGTPTKDTRRKIIEHKQEEVKRYRKRESDLAYTLGTLIRWAHMAMTAIKTIDDMEKSAAVINALPFWEHYHDVLVQGDADERRKVIMALKDFEIIERNTYPLFMPDFDFSGWLRGFINGEPQNEDDRVKVSVIRV